MNISNLKSHHTWIILEAKRGKYSKKKKKMMSVLPNLESHISISLSHCLQVIRALIYLTSCHVKIWHKTVLWRGPCTNMAQDCFMERAMHKSCVPGARIHGPHWYFPDGAPQAQSNKQAKPWGDGPLRSRCYRMPSTAWYKCQVAANKDVYWQVIRVVRAWHNAIF